MPQTVTTRDGVYVGTESDEVVQFKGVPFGTIPGRFQPPVMADNVGIVDCTEQGTLCPQDELYSDSYLGVDPVNVHPIDFKVDELSCLNLFITAPATCKSPVPVVVWIHGGSNTMGTAYRGVYDPKEWVRNSIKMKKPVIVVLVQFRVHVFGFLPFKGVGNYGLMDQKLGIEWTYKNIKYWGGDPSKISVFGQSSGSQCAYVQSCHPQKVFRQAAYLSGSVDKFRSRSLEEYRGVTMKLCEALRCTEGDLETIPWQEIVRGFRETGVQVLSPVDDGVFLPKGGYEVVPQLDAALLSDCIRDGWFFGEGQPPGQLAKVLGPYLSAPLASRIVTNEEACAFLTGQIFFRGNYSAARRLESAGVQTYTQCFDATNPIRPEIGNIHMVDLFYFMGSYEILPEFQPLAQKVQELITRFAWFQEPWKTSEIALVTEKVEIIDAGRLGEYRDLSALEVELDFEVVRKVVTGW